MKKIKRKYSLNQNILKISQRQIIQRYVLEPMKKIQHTNISCKGSRKLTEKEIEKEVFLLDKFREELLNDRTRADAFFQIVGIYDSEGKLKKEFGGEG